MRWLILVGIALVLPGTACDDRRPTPASCGQVLPCGGDLVGNWQLDGTCVHGAAFAPFYQATLDASCAPEVTVTDDVTGSYVPTMVSFAADGTYAGTFTLRGTIGLRFPNSCLPGTCADLDAKVSAMDDPEDAQNAASCRQAGNSCSCTIKRGFASVQTGTYTADGYTVLTDPSDGPGIYARYCVREDELHLVSLLPKDASQDSALAFVSDIVLVRR
jgi:hypothetical protein